MSWQQIPLDKASFEQLKAAHERLMASRKKAKADRKRLRESEMRRLRYDLQRSQTEVLRLKKQLQLSEHAAKVISRRTKPKPIELALSSSLVQVRLLF